MKCPKCGFVDDKVIDTRSNEEGRTIRRRRECLSCSFRFSTIERIEGLCPKVIKKDNTRQEFSSQKLLDSINVACSKRPVSNEEMLSIVQEVEQSLAGKRNGEITTNEIGELVMGRLKQIDKVAYVRFASVYRDFTDISSFTKEIEKINEDN